jgi:hypothetical protein
MGIGASDAVDGFQFKAEWIGTTGVFFFPEAANHIAAPSIHFENGMGGAVCLRLERQFRMVHQVIEASHGLSFCGDGGGVVAPVPPLGCASANLI